VAGFGHGPVITADAGAKLLRFVAGLPA
jgi:hypothetical protein